MTMIEREIPKDISKFETKLVGPFTSRQTGCIVASAGVCFIMYNTLSALQLDATLVIFICFLCCTPFVAMGWKKPYGMTFEKFAMHYVTYFVLAPSKRKYKTVTNLEKYEKKYEEIARTKKNTKKQTTIEDKDENEYMIVYELPKPKSIKHKKSKIFKEYL